jgi:single-stranded-DNA-specific exonuclease
MPEIFERPVDAQAVARLAASGCDPRLARIYAARGLASTDELATTLKSLAAPERLLQADDAARLLADAIARREKLLIVADYDADGATACALGVKALRAMGAVVDYVVPNRRIHGYGLTPEIAREAAARSPAWLITVDNGIAAVEGIAEANRLGMRVLVTDHHLPGAERPAAACIVNPNQHGCGFPSKNLAGVGVVFYVMLALRAELRRRGAFTTTHPEPNLAELLDLVALGTVADVVKLDANNRILVAQGLARIRAGKASPGIAALLSVAGRDARRIVAADLGFAVGPRLNAAGRLEDMSTGIECLLARDHGRAYAIATKLDALNRERRDIESKMQDSALAMLDRVEAGDAWCLTMHHPDWHPGVVGILASRLKDRFHRPVFAFATEGDGTLRGSGRSIAALHLRDALDPRGQAQPGIAGALRRPRGGRGRHASPERTGNVPHGDGSGRAREPHALRPRPDHRHGRNARRRGNEWRARLRDPGAGVGPRISRAALRGALHRRGAARRGGTPLEADTRVRRAALQRHPLRLARRAAGLHSSRLPARHRELSGGRVAAAHARALPTSIIAPWKPTASTPSKTPFATWASGQPSCGGIFDYDAKKSRLVEVSRALEDPGVWTDAKRAQDLGKERSALDATVSQLESIDVGLRDSGELFSLARGEGDDDTLESLVGDVAGLERPRGRSRVSPHVLGSHGSQQLLHRPQRRPGRHRGAGLGADDDAHVPQVLRPEGIQDGAARGKRR